MIDRLNLGRKLLNIRLIPGILAVLYFVRPYYFARPSYSFRADACFQMLSVGRRTIVRWLEDDRSPTNGQSFAARRTTYRLYPNNELIPSKKNNGSERK
ncbi:hypothetical protein [Parabacteroides johnsonii]|uniref:hypothetical protein n=1 Tax=Parabacteroides johnsonii TaxID=387661 RepID=UPI00307EDB88